MSGFNRTCNRSWEKNLTMPMLLQYEPADCMKSLVGQTLTTSDLSGAWCDQMFALLSRRP